MVTFILGLLVGTLLGMIVMSMCVVAKQPDGRSVFDTHAESVEDTPSDGEKD